MFRNEIDAIFTQKVAEYIGKGYSFSTNTMGGSQGEIAKVDLRKENDVIRIMLEHQSDWRTGDRIVLMVGRFTGQLRGFENETIWASDLETVEQVDFSEVARNRVYATAEDFPAIKAKQDGRFNFRYSRREDSYKDFNDGAKEIVLSFVRRQPKCKSVRPHEIERVYKRIYRNSGDVRYYVRVRGMDLRLK